MTGAQQVRRRVDSVDLGRFEGDHCGVLRSPHASQPRVVGSGYPAQERRQSVRLSRTDDQVPGVRQDAVRDQPHRMTTQASVQNREKRAIVGRSEKNRPAVRRIADHVEEPRADSRLPRCQHSTVSFRDGDVSHVSKVGAVRRRLPISTAVGCRMSVSAVPRLGILISGRGTNLQSLIRATQDGRLNAEIGVVISNRRDAAGLEHARASGLSTVVLPHRDFPSRAAFDQALGDALLAERIDMVCLAGFMRLVGRELLDRFPNAVLNIHPSLLPAFPGPDAQQQAVDHGVKVSGVTVHFVTPELDRGPIVLQRSVPVLDDDTGETLAARILPVEHQAYPEAVQRILRGRWRLVGRRVLFDQPDALR